MKKENQLTEIMNLNNIYDIDELLLQNGFKKGGFSIASVSSFSQKTQFDKFIINNYVSDFYFIRHVFEKETQEPMVIAGMSPRLKNELMVGSISSFNNRLPTEDFNFDFKINLSRITSKKLYTFFKEILDLKDFKNLNKKNSHWRYTLKDFLNCMNPNDFINIDLPTDMDCDLNEYLLKNLPNTVKHIQPLQNRDNLTNFTALNEDGSTINIKFIK